MPRRLDERLIEFAAAICIVSRGVQTDPASQNFAKQIVRCATAPVANYAEARESVSPREYVFKVKLCIKELRETHAWLRLAQRGAFGRIEVDALEAECNELLAMMITCVKKARAQPD
jgi:four helix bundle protein